MHRTDCECVRVAETNQESEVRTLHRVCRAMIARALGTFGLFFGAVRRAVIPAGSLVFVLSRWAFGQGKRASGVGGPGGPGRADRQAGRQAGSSMGHRAGARPFTAGGSVGSITCGRPPPQQARAPVIGRRADPTLRPSHSARCHRVCSSTASSESVPPHRSFSIAFLPLPQRSRPSSYNSLPLHLASRSVPFHPPSTTPHPPDR